MNIKCLLLCPVLAGVQYGSGQATAILICMETVRWEGDVEDIRGEDPDSAMLAHSTNSKRREGDRS